MTGHDPVCPLDDMPTFDCTVCTAIGAARGEERAEATLVWKQNLRPLEVRNYERGYRDAVNGRRPAP